MSIQDLAAIANVLTFLLAIPVVLIAYRELRLNTRVQRAQFLLDATERYFGNAEERGIYYDIDYRQFNLCFAAGEPDTIQRGKEPPKPFIGSSEERLLDSILYSFDVIGRIVEMGALDERDARIFAFQAERVLSNREVAKYIVWVTSQRILFGGEVPAHRAAQKLVEGVKASAASALHPFA
jgi:hypothetical protein